MAQNRTGQTGDQDCSGHTPEQIYAGERQQGLKYGLKLSHKILQLATKVQCLSSLLGTSL